MELEWEGREVGGVSAGEFVRERVEKVDGAGLVLPLVPRDKKDAEFEQVGCHHWALEVEAGRCLRIANLSILGDCKVSFIR